MKTLSQQYAKKLDEITAEIDNIREARMLLIGPSVQFSHLAITALERAEKVALDHYFRVRKLYLNAVSRENRAALQQKLHPDTNICEWM